MKQNKQTKNQTTLNGMQVGESYYNKDLRTLTSISFISSALASECPWGETRAYH